MRPLRLALQFLTILPFRLSGEVGPPDLRAALAWFPLAGLMIGGAMAGLAQFGLQGRLGSLLLVATAVLLTGCLHLDGLADLADACCARKDREGRLAVMRDPRIGAAGAVAIVMALLLRWEMTASLAGKPLLRALLAAPVLGRSAMVLALRVLPPAREDGLGRTWGPPSSFSSLLALGSILLLPSFLIGWPAGLGVSGLSLSALTLVSGVAFRMLGGVTGDVCGAAGEMAELAALGGFVLWGAVL